MQHNRIKSFLTENTPWVKVYFFALQISVRGYSIVLQQSEKDIFTGVVSFCEAALFIIYRRI